jgi:hypothetical protein
MLQQYDCHISHSTVAALPDNLSVQCFDDTGALGIQWS